MTRFDANFVIDLIDYYLGIIEINNVTKAGNKESKSNEQKSSRIDSSLFSSINVIVNLYKK